jgi:hypothetical protein
VRMPYATASLTWRGKDRRWSGNRCPSSLTTLTMSSTAGQGFMVIIQAVQAATQLVCLKARGGCLLL